MMMAKRDKKNHHEDEKTPVAAQVEIKFADVEVPDIASGLVSEAEAGKESRGKDK